LTAVPTCTRQKDALRNGLKGKLAIYFSELDLYAVFKPAEYARFVAAVPNEIIDCAYVDYYSRKRVFICSHEEVSCVEQHYGETEATTFALSHGRYCAIVDERTINYRMYDADDLWASFEMRDSRIVPRIESIEVKGWAI
jgi:hypothetical protein